MNEDQNWENGSFDEFIRRSVEDPQLEFDPGAWEAMEEKLDARAGENRSGRTGHAGKIGGGLLALLMVSLLGWFLLSDTVENTTVVNNKVNEQLSDPASAGNNVSAGLQGQEVSAEAGEEAGEKVDLAVSSGGNTTEAGTEAGLAAEKDRPGSSGNRGDGPESHPAAKSASMGAGSSSSAGPGDAGSGSAGAPAGFTDLAINTGNTNNSSKGGAGALGERKSAGQSLQRMPWQTFIFDKVEIHVVRQAEQKEILAGKKEVVALRGNDLPLSLSLSLAPDFSGTGEDASTGLGAGAGLHLEYRVLPRLGIVTGLVYSQKNYLARSGFSAYDFGYYRPRPDYIDGSCAVLDIPLNLRYYFFRGKRHSFFLSSGLSSYLMQREDYTMVYKDVQYEDYTYELRNENRHYFAVYNFSAGYEARLSPRWALQAEPFLKVPAKGVGAGAIRLNSMGAFVHLRYQIGRLGK